MGFSEPAGLVLAVRLPKDLGEGGMQAGLEWERRFDGGYAATLFSV